MSMTGKERGKYEKIVLMLKVHKIHRQTTAWFIEASHTTWITWWSFCQCTVSFLNDPRDGSSLAAGALRKKAEIQRGTTSIFRRNIENVECDACFNAFLKWCTSLSRQRGVGPCAVFTRNTLSGWQSHSDLSLWSC